MIKPMDAFFVCFVIYVNYFREMCRICFLRAMAPRHCCEAIHRKQVSLCIMSGRAVHQNRAVESLYCDISIWRKKNTHPRGTGLVLTVWIVLFFFCALDLDRDELTEANALKRLTHTKFGVWAAPSKSLLGARYDRGSSFSSEMASDCRGFLAPTRRNMVVCLMIFVEYLGHGIVHPVSSFSFLSIQTSFLERS